MPLNRWFWKALMAISILLESSFALKCLCGSKNPKECEFTCDDPGDVCFTVYQISDKKTVKKACGPNWDYYTNGINKCKDYTADEWKDIENDITEVPVGDELSEKLKREIREILEDLPSSKQDLKDEIEHQLDSQDLDTQTLMKIKGSVMMAKKLRSGDKLQGFKAFRFCSCNSNLCNTDQAPPKVKNGSSRYRGAKWISGFVFGNAIIISLMRPMLGF